MNPRLTSDGPPGARGPPGCQRRATPSYNAPLPTATSPAGPHPVACPPSRRSPAHTAPPQRGFCTIRRTPTACRRRVAPLMLQFPPFARAGTTATPPSAPPTPGRERRQQRTLCPRTHQRRPTRPAAHAPPPQRGGFCTIRRIATACRRRVAPLMAQFPPFAHANHGPPGTSPATPGNNAPCAPGPTSDGPPGVPTRPATNARPRPANQQGHAPLHWWHARSDAVHDGAPRPR